MHVLRNRHYFLLDVVSLIASSLIAHAVRFEGFSAAGNVFLVALVWFAVITVPARLAVFGFFGLYERIWSLASVEELERALIAVSVAGIVSIIFGAVGLTWIGLTDVRVPLSVLALDALLSGGLVILTRSGARFSHRRRQRPNLELQRSVSLPAIIVGAGATGQLVARELETQTRAAFRPVAFLDDDVRKHGMRIGNLKVHGGPSDLPQLARAVGVHHVIIAMPSASGAAIRGIMRLARDNGLEARIVPSLHEHITRGGAHAASLREVRIEDLLRREPIHTDAKRVGAMIRGRTVLVTGAGGSIGSELCRQLAALKPKRLLLVGRGENSIFEIQQEFCTRFPNITTVPVILDVRDRDRTLAVMMKYRPSVVFHAAAHKHVPLMEANPSEALRNNVVGTQSVVDASLATGVTHFVLVSTDKAVRPTSVMGASKRIAEQVVQLAAQRSGHVYVAVRFGNVLGSRGSVVPTFLRQIRSGGPVMVTHPEMRRFFMTIPEAVQLVLQAFALGKGGDVFCLDMGEPVRIVDLACDLIHLSGLQPDVDIEVRFTGARPGEKLYEEMFFSSELAAPTEHPKVLRTRNVDLPALTDARIESLMFDLERGASDSALRMAIHGLVEDYCADPAPPLTVDTERLLMAEHSTANIF